MSANVLSRSGFAVIALCIQAMLAGSADVQYYNHYHQLHHHRHTSHHHHDAMGHRVDDAGHHIDLRGHHTGVVGVYDNGTYSAPSTYPTYSTYGNRFGYGATGLSFSTVPSATVIQNVVPSQPYVVGRVPQNVVPGMMVPQANVSTGKITILNPPDSGGEVRYTLNSNEFNIRPGYSQIVENDRTWLIQFGSGGNRGDVRYTLSPGTFKFKVTEGGWELVRAADQAIMSQLSPQPTGSVAVPAPVPQPNGP